LARFHVKKLSSAIYYVGSIALIVYKSDSSATARSECTYNGEATHWRQRTRIRQFIVSAATEKENIAAHKMGLDAGRSMLNEDKEKNKCKKVIYHGIQVYTSSVGHEGTG